MIPYEKNSRKEMKETFDFSNGLKGPILLTVDTKFYAGAADSIRATIQNDSIKNLTKNFTDFYRNYFSKIESTELISYIDDKNNNIFLLKEVYEIKDSESFGEDDGFLRFRCMDLQNMLTSSNYISRVHPLMVSYPMKMTHTIQVNLPAEIQEESVEKDTIIDDAFILNRHKVFKDKKFRFVCRYQALSDHVMPNRIEDYQSNLVKLFDNIGISVNKALLNGEWVPTVENDHSENKNSFLNDATPFKRNLLQFASDVKNSVIFAFKIGCAIVLLFLIIVGCETIRKESKTTKGAKNVGSLDVLRNMHSDKSEKTELKRKDVQKALEQLRKQHTN
jgi:hypothetical protein